MGQPLTPLADRVIATREEAATRTASGLYLPDSAKEKAIVVSWRPSAQRSKASKGDRIVYKEYTTTEIKVDNKEYLILKEEDVLAKVAQSGNR